MKWLTEYPNREATFVSYFETKKNECPFFQASALANAQVARRVGSTRVVDDAKPFRRGTITSKG
jgi:hypothetical protein